MCPCQPFDRFAERTSREDVLKTEWLQGIQQHDIEIAGDAAMLKGVVEHQHPAAKSVDGSPGGGEPIGILHVRHAGQFPSEFQGFIVGTAAHAIPPADDADFLLLLIDLLYDPFDQRRLAGSTQREIAHADHGHVNAMDAICSGVVASIPPADN